MSRFLYRWRSLNSDSVSRPPSNRHPRKLVPQTDPSTRTSPLNPIFMHGDAPKAHEVLKSRRKGFLRANSDGSQSTVRNLIQPAVARTFEGVFHADQTHGIVLARNQLSPHRTRQQQTHLVFQVSLTLSRKVESCKPGFYKPGLTWAIGKSRRKSSNSFAPRRGDPPDRIRRSSNCR